MVSLTHSESKMVAQCCYLSLQLKESTQGSTDGSRTPQPRRSRGCEQQRLLASSHRFMNNSLLTTPSSNSFIKEKSFNKRKACCDSCRNQPDTNKTNHSIILLYVYSIIITQVLVMTWRTAAFEVLRMAAANLLALPDSSPLQLVNKSTSSR